MAIKQINYEDWLRTRSLVEARAKRVLSFFDLAKLRRKRREGDREDWLKAHKQESKYPPASKK